MREAAAIVEPAVDINQITREILKEHVALQEDERNADAHERKGATFRKSAARRHVEIGRRLIEVKRVTKHGGWLPYLEKCGIDERRAREWMQLAGWVESKSATCANAADLPDAPTLAEAGIDKRPRKRDEIDRAEQPDLPQSPNVDSKREQPALDIDRELARIQNKICEFAESVPLKARKLIAHELRETARLIEEMQ
jgi:hypothetical protein